MKKVVLTLTAMVSLMFAGVIAPDNNGEMFTAVSDAGGVKLLTAAKSIVALATMIKVDTDDNNNKPVIFINGSDDDDYIVVQANFFEKYGDFYTYDLTKDPEVASLFRRATTVKVMFYNFEHGSREDGSFMQIINCSGYTRYYNQLKQ